MQIAQGLDFICAAWPTWRQDIPLRNVILGLVPRICRRWRFRSTVDTPLRRPSVPTRYRW